MLRPQARDAGDCVERPDSESTDFWEHAMARPSTLLPLVDCVRKAAVDDNAQPPGDGDRAARGVGTVLP